MRTISRQINKLFLIVFLTITSMAVGQASLTKTDVSIYPKPEKGYKQMIIEVPHSDNDSNKKIEFVIGKWMEVDTCNKHGLIGSIEKKDLEGWGYSYYDFKTDGGVISTRMACFESSKVKKFVSSQPTTVRYNGKLPIVIYVPEGYEVQFKIFKAEDDVYRASEVKQK
ncbi:ecotin family protein [Tenacibaculum sp. 1B UA]|uniref:ecotin n=1 Tax=Tenacibaculum sp. 1B UA TaxID=2922252 RepID=UPI002A24A7B8|nr:ecotin family protein [Tenacibaculum sp. 1B UA]MDX8554208.1 ecotin family protein [Tenacibaculum sp. 1B UA]